MGGLSEIRASAKRWRDLASKSRKRVSEQFKPLRGTSGSQLLELALTLPFLLILAVGLSDMGGAYNLKHIMTNAARDAARVTVSNPLTDISCQDATPCSIEGAADAAKQYLLNAGKSTASCITPNSPSSSGTFTWTYSCAGGITLTINRGAVYPGGAGGSVISSTQVTLTYPYTWTFSNLMGLLVKGATLTPPATLTTTVVMQNLVPNGS
jgi:Flp pilus assembly protein TadG